MPDRLPAARLLTVCFGLLLAACAVPVRDDVVPAPAPTASVDASSADEASVPAAQADAPETTVDNSGTGAQEPPPDEPVVTSTLWQSIVARHAFVTCDEPAPAVRRWQRIYTQSPKRHAESLSAAAPWIAYVADELARRDLPSEYVWLPFVESRYQAFRTRGDRPAGAWQLMPATARWRGLRIADDYDGRLDFVAATRAALDLIEHLAEVFGRDWALVTMAYNAGEYRIKGALERARKAGRSLQAEHLAVSPITHEHLVKLRALACVAARPETMALTLPDFDRDKQLSAITVPQAMNVAQLATLSGATTTQFQQWNPAWRRGHVDAGADILLPRSLVERNASMIANATPTPIQAVAVATLVDGDRVHVVRSGESAWQIARHHRVTLAALLAANGLTAKSTLRPGQKLRLP